MQIRSKLTLQFSVLASAILLIAFLLLYFFAYRFNQQEFYKRLQDKALTSVILLVRISEVDSSLMKTIDRAKQDVLYGENITIYEDDKEIYTNNDTVFFKITPQRLAQIRRDKEVHFSERDFEILGIVFSNQGKDHVVIAGAIDIRGNRQLAQLRVLLISLFGIIIAVVVISGWIFAGRALAPVNSLIAELQAISVLDLHQRVRSHRHQDEIGKLISIFNGLLARIERAFDLQKSFVRNVSHELRNPLTRITSQLEVTLLKERPVAEYQRTALSVLEDIKEMNMLSTSLLDLASLHEDVRDFTMVRVRVDEALWEVLASVKESNPLYQTEIVSAQMPEFEQRLYIDANPYLLKTAIRNIVENACKFSADHMARITFTCSQQTIQIRVADNGPGIGKDDLENIFQPFYRADRTSKIKGYGVGLSLSQRIIKIHNGTIDVESSIGKGTVVTIQFDAPMVF